MVDNYIGLRTLVHLKNSPTGVNIILFSDNVGNNKLHNIEYTDFRKEYPTVKLSMKKTGGIFHDRFIVLDYGTADWIRNIKFQFPDESLKRFVCCRECKRKINGINEEKHIPSYVQMV